MIREKILLRWGDFRRKAITNIVKSFNSIILNRRPDCLLSAAVKPNPNEAKNRFFQEWDLWLAEGLIDYAVPMNYATKPLDFIYQINSNLKTVSRICRLQCNQKFLLKNRVLPF